MPHCDKERTSLVVCQNGQNRARSVSAVSHRIGERRSFVYLTTDDDGNFSALSNVCDQQRQLQGFLFAMKGCWRDVDRHEEEFEKTLKKMLRQDCYRVKLIDYQIFAIY